MSSRSVLALVLILGGGCRAIKEQLAADETQTASSQDAPDEDVENESEDLDEESEADALDDEESRRRKRARARKRRRAAKPPPPPPPVHDLQAALADAIVAPKPDQPTAPYRLDSFVLTLAAQTLTRDEGKPFSRTTKAERKTGVPAALRVGTLPPLSLWHQLGLREGDLILGLDEHKPPGPKRARKWLETVALDATITIELQRDGKPRTLKYALENGLAWKRYLEREAKRTFVAPKPPSSSSGSSSRPSSKAPSKSSGSKSSGSKSSGSKPATVPVSCSGSTCTIPQWYFDQLVGSSSKAKAQARGKQGSSGFKLSFVGPASRKAGFAVGDLIIKVNGRRLGNTLEALSLYGSLKKTKKFRMEWSRGTRKRTTTILVK